MNAIISLCHFCELHGPKVLFCTQPFHPEEKTVSAGDSETEGADGSIPSRRHVASSAEPMTPQTPTHNSLPNYKNDLCEGCTSVHLGFVSHDEEAAVSYMSSQRPQHRDVFAMVRQACIRSLSCEVCPGREGPIFFGDEQQGHAISYTFYIKDYQARGFQRLYSVIVVMMDKIYLLNSWPFLVSHIETVVEHLKSKASVVFENEKVKMPLRQYRLTSTSVNPKNFIQQRGGNVNKPARSLNELTDDKHVFKVLHTSFVWILKACGNRLSETLLEGPPTEDSIIDMEKQEETEEGFVKLFSKKLGIDDDLELGLDVLSNPGTNPGDNGTIDEVVEDDGSPEIIDIRHIYKLLGSRRFHVLAHHVVIGNQIILRGKGRTLIRTFQNALTWLLPKGCYRAVPYSDEYVESYRCNFLGLNPAVSIPSYVNTSEPFLLVDIYEPEDVHLESPDPFKGYIFKLSTFFDLDKVVAPSVLQKMEHAIVNDSLSIEVVDQCLICLKEEWMNKVKVMFKFTKAGGGRSEEDAKNLLKIVGATDDDKPLLSYWMRGLSDQYKKHILSASRQHVL
ncbi:hypothetical protein ACF0H5_000607 [Mactra antiquata]